MDILVVQAFCFIGLFLSTLILIVLPTRLIGKKRDTSKTFFGKYETLISFANCLSGGVFLATFFVGLLPEVRIEIVHMLETFHVSTSIPVTEVIVLVGFFLAMFVEQLAINVKDMHKNHRSKSKRGESGNVEAEQVEEAEPVNDVRSCTDGTGSTSLAGNIEEDGNGNEGEEESLNDTEAKFVVIAQLSVAANPQLNHANNHRVLDKHQNHVGHDHGHGHSHNVDALLDSTAGVRLGILLLSLGVHCLFEGMALGLQNEIHTLVNLFIGIWIHECLIALALGFSMVRAGPKTCRMLQIALFFSSIIPIGQVIGIVIGSSRSWTSRVVSTILQAIAAGTFVQVTFLDIIPEGLGRVGSPKRLAKVGLLFLGFVVITTVSLLVEAFGSHSH